MDRQIKTTSFTFKIMSTKLHEILAVEADREAAATAVLNETLVTFTKKPEHFIGKHTIYKALTEGDTDGEGEEASKEIVDTALGKLRHCFSIINKAIDVTATKDATNQLAHAEIIIDGKALTTPLPATTLLTLEKKIKQWLDVLLQIPTLAPGRVWVLDATKGPNIYRDEAPEARYRTKKVIQHKILVEPTTHHPAQVEKWSEDVRVGKLTDTSWSSMMSPAEKSQIITRATELLAAVKQARQRANTQEVVQVDVAKTLTDFIIG